MADSPDFIPDDEFFPDPMGQVQEKGLRQIAQGLGSVRDSIGQTAAPFEQGIDQLSAGALQRAGTPQDRAMQIAQNIRENAQSAGSTVGGIKDVAGEALAMDKATRMARAKAMGFDTKNKWYHGTDADIGNEFRDLKEIYDPKGINKWGKGNYFTTNKSAAEGYGKNLHEVFLKDKNLLDLSNPDKVLEAFKKINLPNAEEVLSGANKYKFDKEFSHFIGAQEALRKAEKLSPTKARSLLIDKLRDSGYHGLSVPEEGIVNIFDPSSIRSTNAAFDPANASSKNILAGAAGAGAVGAGVTGSDDAQGYADGGTVQDFIPDGQFKPDTTAPVDRSPDFIPDSQFVSDEEKHGGLGSQIGTALEGAASAATFGLSTGLEKKIGKDLRVEALSPENIRARRETNPISHGAGQIAGLVGSSFLVPGGGAAGALEAAGTGTARAVGLGAAEGAAAKIGSSAVKAAVENMLVQGGDEVSKMFAGNYADPSEAVQTAAVNIGLSGLIGGGIGGALGAVSPLYKATVGKKLDYLLGDMGNAAEHALASNAPKPSPITQEFQSIDPYTFVQAKALNKRGQFLSPSTPEELANHKLFMTSDGVGYAMSPEGDLQQVFNNSDRPGAGKEAVIHAIANGAKSLDAFDGFLPEYYNKFGFTFKNADKWNDAYAPKGWDYAKFGKPDVVYMEYPQSLSRDANAIAARHEAVGAEKLARSSGSAGQNTGVSTNGSLIDWKTRGEIPTGSSSPSSGSASTDLLSHLPEDYLQKRMVDEAAGTFKPNADEISAASARLGVKPTAGTLSNVEFIQHMEDSLIKRPTIFGQKAAKETMDVYEGLNKAGLKTLRDATTKSEYEVGKEIKDGIVASVKKDLAPLEASYKELEPHFKAIDVASDLKNEAIKPLLAMADESSLKLAEEINGKITNVNDIKQLRTKINARIGDAVRGGYKGASEEIPALYEAKNALTKMREDAIEAASKATGIGEKESGQISQKLIDDIRTTDKGYRAVKDNIRKLGVEGGLGNLGSARQLIEKFEKLPDENLAKRFFDLGDVNQLKYFKEKFPKEFELGRRYKLKEVLENSISEAQGKNGRFEVGRYLRQLSDTKLGPEAREILMGGHTEAANDIRTLFQALPGNANPSGTAAALAHGSLFSLQGLADNASDAVKYAVLKRLPEMMKAAGTTDSKATGLAALAFMKSGQPIEGSAFKAAVDYISHTIKGENLVGKAAKGVFRAGEQVLPTKLIPDDKSREKLDKKLKELQTNQEPLFDVGGKTAHYLPEHGTAIASTAMNAVSYLNSIRPVPEKQSPLDSEPILDKAQTAKFNKALDIAQQPLIVMDDIKNGTLSPSDIKTLHTLYPALYSRLSTKLYNEMMETVNAKEVIPYQTRMGVSMFLGNPLDSTLKPNAIIAAQGTFMRPSQQKDEQAKQVGPGPHSMKSLAKLPSQYATPQQAREAQKIKA